MAITDVNSSPEVGVRKLSHEVAHRFRDRIVSGELQPGERLPAESDLVEIFKVSKPTLREALRILESEGLIRVGRGSRSGAVVQVLSMARTAQYASMVLASQGTTLSEVHEVRRLLEPSLARRLCGKAWKGSVARLTLHGLGKRSHPYGYGTRFGPSQASVHSLRWQRRLLTDWQSSCASNQVTKTRGRSPSRFGHSWRSMQKRPMK